MDLAEGLPTPGGGSLPRIGLGLYGIGPDQLDSIVRTAVDLGYRLFDTASYYGNEELLGRALRRSGRHRSEIVVTTKLWNADQGYASTLSAFEGSRRRLGLEYVDLYLIHWPAPRRGLFVESWRALQRLRDDGLVRTIGVSNFEVEHLEAIMQAGGEPPAVNQIEVHPELQQAELRAYHRGHGIATQAWSPLARGALLANPTITTLARRRGATPGQLVLAWHLHVGNAVIPRTANPGRLTENLGALNIRLETGDLAEIAGLERARRRGGDPRRLH